MLFKKNIIKSTVAALALAGASAAQAVPVTLTQLTGVTGGTLAATTVFKADLSSILQLIGSISIRDNSSGLGGAGGQFSGFDLDAIKLSSTDCATAACAAAAVGLSVFDFASTVFQPGVQRAPADPKLFGTGPGGNTLDNGVARLGAFDGESTVAIPGAEGFISMGDNGLLGFNLSSAISASGLFLYIGEVGNNGEVAASNIQINRDRIDVPEPASGALMLLGAFGLLLGRRRQRK